MILRDYKNEDGALICSWIRDEDELYRWSADRFNKYPLTGDDINESYKSITYNCSKARGLSLEYYLNCIFMEIFNQTNCLERYIILALFY